MYPLNLSYLSKKLNEGASEIKRSLAQYKIDIIERGYLNGERVRGILLFRYPMDIDRIFARYVPEYQKGFITDIFNSIKLSQSTFEDIDQKRSEPDGPLPQDKITSKNFEFYISENSFDEKYFEEFNARLKRHFEYEMRHYYELEIPENSLLVDKYKLFTSKAEKIDFKKFEEMREKSKAKGGNEK